VAPYDYVEIIDIADADMFGQDVATEKMQEIAAEFSGMAEATFLTTEPL
jgi:threonine aldolase